MRISPNQMIFVYQFIIFPDQDIQSVFSALLYSCSDVFLKINLFSLSLIARTFGICIKLFTQPRIGKTEIK